MPKVTNVLRPAAICGVAIATLTTASFGAVVAQAQQPTPAAPLPTVAPADVTAVSVPQTEADLRVTLATLLQEHTYLAGNAIAPVLGGDQAQATAAAAVLDENTQQLAQLLGAFYGPEAEQTFLQLWRRHIADYVQYARAGLNGDSAARQQAQQDLSAFTQDMDQFLTATIPTLAPGTVQTGLTMHVQGTTQVIDALQAKDYATAFNLAKQGAAMTSDMGDPLAEAIAQQMPTQFAATQPNS